jgi:basic membrane lipoprotein Med (substrate-binding protein (PBP1-ABC) superfamily)
MLRFVGFILCLVACSQRDTNRNAGDDKRFRVALLTPGPISDQSWNAGAYQGLLRIRDSLAAEISHIQTKTPAEFEENFRHYGAEGYQLVFGHGFEFQDAAQRVASDYPKTVFVTTSGNTVGQNLAGMSFSFANPSYLAGMIAGMMTHSNLIGMIGGTELPPVKESFAAFTHGAKRTNPKVKVLVSYIGNWDDVSAGKEQALAQLARGTDIIFQNADAAGLGVFQAVREAHGAFIIGSNSDQNDVAPDVTLGSVVIDLPHAFLALAREVKSGHFRARVFALGLEDDVVSFKLNPTVKNRIPAAVLSLVDSVRTSMLKGTFSAADTSITP